MNDLDICKRIAEIEGYKTNPCEGYGVCAYKGDLPDNFMGYSHIPYNPLTDNSLCFNLMIKHKISLIVNVNGYDALFKGFGDEYGNYKTFIANHKSPNKAICLAIIEAHKD